MTREFDVCGPLPAGGVTVLEASAGTGKTYALAALAARYVAEGHPLDSLLLVTFTRMATGELRERVRERLVAAEQALDHALAGALPPDADEVVRLLAERDVELHRDRLSRALADFDAATIATTHGFCQEVLAGLGAAGDVERECAFVEDVSDLLDEIVDDLYVRRFRRYDPLMTREEAMKIASIAVGNPSAPIEPRDAEATSKVAVRARLAAAVREEFEVRKRRLGILTYDDLLERLALVLRGPRGEEVAERLRDRYRIVLVDEFQDTDPVQWDIMRRAFADGGGTLVLIGDPKQAIYAFRGADVYAYLQAASTAGAQATLAVNWRSDQALLTAFDALFGGARLGHEGIVYRQVRAAPANRDRRLHGAPVPAPLRVRIVDRLSTGTTPRGYAKLDAARRHVAVDAAGEIVALLRSGAMIECRSDTGAILRSGPVRPGDVAVLVRTHKNAALVRDALEQHDVPAVINGAGSVFGTDPATDWLRLLEALERPASSLRARAVALTRFLGWSTERVAVASEDEWEDVHRRLHGWARVLRDRGVAALLETITLVEGLPERVLGRVDGERSLTDLRHIGQLLHAAAVEEHLGTTALTGWLRRRIAAAAEEGFDEERSRRLESDAEAVQVLTIHRAKGLEYPVVFYPDLFEPTWVPDRVPVVFHDMDRDDERTIDVALEGGDFDAHFAKHIEEQRGEDLRLLYVALTRAQHQAVIWWAGSFDSRNSALTRLLFSQDDLGNVAPSADAVPSDADMRARVLELAGSCGDGCIAVETAEWRASGSYAGAGAGGLALDARTFSRSIDTGWRRTSYSAITAAAHEARVGSEPEEGQHAVVDEPTLEEAVFGAEPPAEFDLLTEVLRGTPSLLGGMPMGLHVGTFVHRVFETTDFAAGDLRAELSERVALARRSALDLGGVDAVVAGLHAAIETPLGPLVEGRSLRSFGAADRLDELAFELPLAGGDAPTGRVTPSAIGALLRRHVPRTDPLAGYVARLDDASLERDIRGYLAGSIDLVLRFRASDGSRRYVIADYKTNYLAPPDEELTAWHFRPAALLAEMERYHYALQALLYTAALHRYLRWRDPSYSASSLAGVLYLFVRGMTGPDTPLIDGVPAGVFSWRPPAALVEALSDLLDTGTKR